MYNGKVRKVAFPLHDQICQRLDLAIARGANVELFDFHGGDFEEEDLKIIMTHLSDYIAKKFKWITVFIFVGEKHFHLYIVKDPIYVCVLHTIYRDYYKEDFITFTVLQYSLLGYSKEALDKRVKEICSDCEEDE